MISDPERSQEDHFHWPLGSAAIARRSTQQIFSDHDVKETKTAPLLIATCGIDAVKGNLLGCGNEPKTIIGQGCAEREERL